jgi:DNA-binding transcriptional ArsR family regulator
MALSRKQVTDVDTLRALAHPLRVRLLGALRLDGSATASELGRRFGESSGSTSYHLRQLERFGFVVEDDQQPSRRERRWRAAHDVTSFRPADFLDEAAGREALELLDQQWLRFLVDTVQTWHRSRQTWPREWVEAADRGDLVIRLRPGDVVQLSQELFDVVQRWANSPRPATDPQARQVIVHVLATPLAEDVQ